MLFIGCYGVQAKVCQQILFAEREREREVERERERERQREREGGREGE
jgi:hypothetical protein